MARKLSFDELRSLWIQAGGDPQYAGMAASIAMAESGGNNEESKPNTDGSIDRGYWQINSVHGSQSTLDPLANAKAAVAISNNGKDWKAWSTAYSDGAGGTRGGKYLGSGSPFQKFYKATSGAPGQLDIQSLGGGGAASPTDKGTPQAALQAAYERYGTYAAYLDDPEWGPILKQANGEAPGPDGITATRDEAWLEGQLSKTEKWKTTSDTARQFDYLSKTDPATAYREVQKNLYNIRAFAQSEGITMSDRDLNIYAIYATRLGWTPQEIQQNVTAAYKYVSGQATGQAGTDVADLKKLAGDYGVPVSEDTLGTWVTNMIQGKATRDDFITYATGMAKTMYPTISKQLDQGLTTAQVFDPYRQHAAKLLGLPVDSINLSDPKWNKALTQPPAQANPDGKPPAAMGAPMNLWQWDQNLRSDPQYGYQFTQDAHDQAAALLDTLGKTFGKVA